MEIRIGRAWILLSWLPEAEGLRGLITKNFHLLDGSPATSLVSGQSEFSSAFQAGRSSKPF
jgi:hypothetical protein